MESQKTINIALVGDYSIFRIALRMLLESEPKIKVIAELSSINEIPSLSTAKKPFMLLVDYPDENNEVDWFSILAQYVDQMPILILSGSNNINIYQKCLRLGIHGLVLKDKKAEVLFKAIEIVSRGDFWFERSTMRDTIRQLVNEKQMLFDSPRASANNVLTEREKEVVDLVCKGMKNKDIAEKLFITETTIRHHLTSIFEKFALKSRLELIIYAFKHNLVELPQVMNSRSNNHKVYSDYPKANL